MTRPAECSCGRCGRLCRDGTRPALAALIAALAVLLVRRRAVGHGLVNYDTLYALVWGRDLATARLPDYGVAIAPTPHPLADVAGDRAQPR